MFDGWWLPPADLTPCDRARRAVHTHVAAAALIFIMAQFALVAIVWKLPCFGAEALQATLPSDGKRVELFCDGATTVLFLGLLLMGAQTWAGVQFTAAPPDAEPVEVLARQFAWSFRYPGADRRFGRTNPAHQ